MENSAQSTINNQEINNYKNDYEEAKASTEGKYKVREEAFKAEEEAYKAYEKACEALEATPEYKAKEEAYKAYEKALKTESLAQMEYERALENEKEVRTFYHLRKTRRGKN